MVCISRKSQILRDSMKEDWLDRVINQFILISKKMLDINKFTGTGMYIEGKNEKTVAEYNKGKRHGIGISRVDNNYEASEYVHGKKQGIEIAIDENQIIHLNEYIEGNKTSFGTHIKENGDIFLGDKSSNVGVYIRGNEIYTGEMINSESTTGCWHNINNRQNIKENPIKPKMMVPKNEK